MSPQAEEEQNAVQEISDRNDVSEDSIENSSSKRAQNVRVLIAARNELRHLQNKVEKRGKHRLSSRQIRRIAELKNRIRELESENVLLVSPTLAEKAQAPRKVGVPLTAATAGAVAEEPEQKLTEKQEETSKTSVSISKMLTNIWFLRSLMLASGMIVGILLLAYSLIFINTFATFGNTTSYFPWAWDESYSSAPPVQNLFSGGIIVSLVTISGCAVAIYYMYPKLKPVLTTKRSSR